MNMISELEQHPELGWIKKGSKATTEYCLEYEHDGSMWTLNFFAADWDDAERKTESIKTSLRLLGRLDETIEYTHNV